MEEIAGNVVERGFNDRKKHSIGLRMVSRIAKSMNYQNLLGLNVLTIRV